MATEERMLEAEGDDVAYKTKVIEFLGRSTPIVLQNDNGPCPLLAICNVLLLRNTIHLSLDAPEVTLQKLLSLIAERLIDSNSNMQDKDDGFQINQQQNIADAIDLLPRLATGIDVNVQFRKINDFEFTPECAIFDLLDIGLYHGWIVDPQDSDTAAAIGSKSYNALAGELVAFEARKSDVENKKIPDTDSVDFAAATTAALGVPSPSISRGRSFDHYSDSLPAGEKKGKGDKEEEEVLMRVLNLSKAQVSSPANNSISAVAHSEGGTAPFDVSASEISAGSFMQHNNGNCGESDPFDKVVQQQCYASSDCKDDIPHTEIFSADSVVSIPKSNGGNNADHATSVGSAFSSMPSDLTSNIQQISLVRSTEVDVSDGPSAYKEGECPSCNNISSAVIYAEDSLTSQLQDKIDDNVTHQVPANFNNSDDKHPKFRPPVEEKDVLDVSEIVSSLAMSEPIYEGEDQILDSRLPAYEDREPIYEGEVALAERVDKAGEDVASLYSSDQVTEQQCHLIKNFLEGMASQLTIYGLFCLQEGLKERELCVFFRNNHFSTMFKFNGELYLLVTDQGYMNQTDLVWEKLNEVNGDTVFMTGNFTQFKSENQANGSWNEQNAISSTADYLATLEGSVPSRSSLSSDLQLAIALQQQEFDQQPQQQQQQSTQQSTQQPSVSGRSRLITGPQVSRNTNVPQKSESKLKEKCSIM